MPRRPRPASRPRPRHAANHRKDVELESKVPELAGSVSDDFFEDGASSSWSGSKDQEQVDISDGTELQDGGEPDAPRVAQWVDDEGLDEETSSDSSGDEEGNKSLLQENLHSLSFGALRKAHITLAADSEDEDNHMDSETEGESNGSADHFYKGEEKEVHNRPKKEVPKRKHKHAPMEMSSKRPVSRSRFVAEEKIVPRDPRFLSMTGEFDAKRFQNQYNFLSSLHQEELSTLRENLKRARKLLSNSPRDLRDERAAEVDRLERAVKRAESAVNKDHREQVEMQALSKLAKQEREKQKQGKKAWFLKDADKKELLLRAKYEALAERGGRGAVRKAIEKKQKKVSQKEKKKRPFATGPPSGSGGPPRLKRAHSHTRGDDGPRKRTRPS